jgi:hypothetical protein
MLDADDETTPVATVAVAIAFPPLAVAVVVVVVVVVVAPPSTSKPTSIAEQRWIRSFKVPGGTNSLPILLALIVLVLVVVAAMVLLLLEIIAAALLIKILPLVVAGDGGDGGGGGGGGIREEVVEYKEGAAPLLTFTPVLLLPRIFDLVNAGVGELNNPLLPPTTTAFTE